MIRLRVVAEGQTEETFVRDVLVEHLAGFGVYAAASCATTSRRPRRPDIAFKGGLVRYSQVRPQLQTWLKQDKALRLTTLFDLYRLPNDFPGFEAACKQQDPCRRVGLLEQALGADIGDERLIPYIQLHEFESLVLVDPSELSADFPAHDKEIKNLVRSIEGQQPEKINDGPSTAPSKRIIAEIPEYEPRKREVGPKTVARIGLPRLRASCPHFHAWLERLEALAR